MESSESNLKKVKECLSSMIKKEESILEFATAKLSICSPETNKYFASFHNEGILCVVINRNTSCLFLQLFDLVELKKVFEIELYTNIIDGYVCRDTCFHTIEFPGFFLGVSFAQPQENLNENRGSLMQKTIVNTSKFIDINSDNYLYLYDFDHKTEKAQLFHQIKKIREMEKNILKKKKDEKNNKKTKSKDKKKVGKSKGKKNNEGNKKKESSKPKKSKDNKIKENTSTYSKQNDSENSEINSNKNPETATNQNDTGTNKTPTLSLNNIEFQEEKPKKKLKKAPSRVSEESDYSRESNIRSSSSDSSQNENESDSENFTENISVSVSTNKNFAKLKEDEIFLLLEKFVTDKKIFNSITVEDNEEDPRVYKLIQFHILKTKMKLVKKIYRKNFERFIGTKKIFLENIKVHNVNSYYYFNSDDESLEENNEKKFIEYQANDMIDMFEDENEVDERFKELLQVRKNLKKFDRKSQTGIPKMTSVYNTGKRKSNVKTPRYSTVSVDT